MENNQLILENCSKELQRLVNDVEHEGMLFIEEDDEDYTAELIEKLEKEVKELGLELYITFGEDDAKITVYGGIVEKFQN